jgi:hypothetical protein
VLSNPEIVLLDGPNRYFRAAVLKARGYRVFTTEHVVEVCLRWAPDNCAALVIGPHIPLQHVATLCEWIKLNSPEKTILLLADGHSGRVPPYIDAVLPAQPVQALVERLRLVLPAAPRQYRAEAGGLGPSGRLRMPARLRHS